MMTRTPGLMGTSVLERKSSTTVKTPRFPFRKTNMSLGLFDLSSRCSTALLQPIASPRPVGHRLGGGSGSGDVESSLTRFEQKQTVSLTVIRSGLLAWQILSSSGGFLSNRSTQILQSRTDINKSLTDGKSKYMFILAPWGTGRGAARRGGHSRT